MNNIALTTTKTPLTLPTVTPEFADMLPGLPYALRLVGSALAPKYPSGSEIVIDPACRIIRPGDAILAHVAKHGGCRPHSGVYFINADGDLYDNHRACHAFGSYRVGGVITGIQGVTR